MAISRMQEPRQLYGLGSLVKKITRPIKKIVKSPIGKAALGAAAIYGLGGGFGGGGFKFGNIGPKFGSLFGGIKSKLLGVPGADEFGGSMGLLRKLGLTKGGFGSLGGLTTKGILGAGGIAGLLGGLFAKKPEETEEEYQARIEQLGPYLRQYYGNVGDTFGDQAMSPGELEDFVTSQSIEYQGAKDGGIMGYRSGGMAGIDKYADLLEKEYNKKSPDPEVIKQLEKILDDFMRIPEADGGIIMADVDEMEVGPKGQEEVMDESMMEDVRPSGLEKVAGTLVDIATTLYKVATPMGMSYKMARAMYDRLPDISKQAVDDMGRKMKGGDDEEMSETLIMVEGKKDGGIMNLGGKEMDLRGGGFVPIGKKERADDVPARLSKNEFVFTADAVRAAGGGSVKKGAQRMYDTMKSLENRIR
jgi:hypothetical protein